MVENQDSGKLPRLDGLAVFSAGEATADERLEGEQQKLAAAYEKSRETNLFWTAMQDTKTTRTKPLDWPVPYNRPLGSFGDDDVVDFLERLKGVHTDLIAEETIERCLEKNIDNGKRLSYRKKKKR